MIEFVNKTCNIDVGDDDTGGALTLERSLVFSDQCQYKYIVGLV